MEAITTSTKHLNYIESLSHSHHVRFGRGGRILYLSQPNLATILKRYSYGLLRSFIELEEVIS